MTPNQALSILDQATARVDAKREEHRIIVQALETLRTLVVADSEQDQNDASVVPSGTAKTTK